MEAIPRISRAQVMDALSSQANVSGYKAVLLAASESTRFFPMLTTAAGTVKPATVLVLGVGVAGLQALATAKRLGGRATGYDVRPEVADQVRSVGAQWLDLGIDAAGEGGYARELTDDERAKQQQALEDAIDQVWLTFDKVVDEVGRLGVPHTSAVEVLTPWMGRAATPLRALNSALTKEKLSALPAEAQVPSVAYSVVAQAVRIFENPRDGVPAVRE